jgi:hypothetical protein
VYGRMTQNSQQEPVFCFLPPWLKPSGWLGVSLLVTHAPPTAPAGRPETPYAGLAACAPCLEPSSRS